MPRESYSDYDRAYQLQRIHVFIYRQTTYRRLTTSNSPLHPRQDFEKNTGSAAEERHGVGTVRGTQEQDKQRLLKGIKSNKRGKERREVQVLL